MDYQTSKTKEENQGTHFKNDKVKGPKEKQY